MRALSNNYCRDLCELDAVSGITKSAICEFYHWKGHGGSARLSFWPTLCCQLKPYSSEINAICVTNLVSYTPKKNTSKGLIHELLQCI